MLKNMTFEEVNLPPKAPPKKSKSVLKRTRQAEKRRLRNQSAKSTLKTLSGKVESDVLSKNTEGARAALKKAISAINKAAAKGVIHKNTAGRKVSRLTRLVNSLLSAQAT